MMANNKNSPTRFQDKVIPRSIDSLSVIREVKKYVCIYDTDHEKYHDQNYKAMVWKNICTSIYPKYDEYSPALQSHICGLVRRRWKSVRNYVAQEAKLMITTEYCRKRDTTQWEEMQFILPYIKTPYCEKFASELGLKRLNSNGLYSSMDRITEDTKTTATESQQSQTSVNIQNERFLISEYVKEEPYEIIDDDVDFHTGDDNEDEYIINHTKSADFSSTRNTKPELRNSRIPTIDQDIENAETILSISSSPPPSALTPITLLHTNENCSTNDDWEKTPPSKRLCIEKKSLCNNKNHEESMTFRNKQCPENEAIQNDQNNKEQNFSMDIQRKLLDLLIDMQHRQLQANHTDNDPNDLDRMFFLSLVPDFKQIPVHKKISVKAKIASLIAEALN
ncbi:uncharacterized protein LOC142230392 [Haematobia irritans]|uniref:uncharacterized protein LOC142230392 n=1 Tax=Haematobia irritans TaxID=7368 RepID=UPI003F5027F5